MKEKMYFHFVDSQEYILLEKCELINPYSYFL